MWSYNCNYLDFINEQTNFDKTQYIHAWIENTSIEDGISFDPYPTSLRIVNLIKWCLSNENYDEKILNSIYFQTIVLSQNIEWHLLANHIISNLKALIFAGYFFKTTFIGHYSNEFWQSSIFFLNEIKHDPIPLWFLILTPVLVVISIPISYYYFIFNTKILEDFKNTNSPLYNFLLNKWYIDELYELLFVNPAKKIGSFFWKKGDLGFIDRFGPDGISKLIKKLSDKAGIFQTGFIYDYAFVMLIGLSILLTYLILN